MNFERGKDPRESLEIGVGDSILKYGTILAVCTLGRKEKRYVISEKIFDRAIIVWNRALYGKGISKEIKELFGIRALRKIQWDSILVSGWHGKGNDHFSWYQLLPGKRFGKPGVSIKTAVWIEGKGKIHRAYR